MFFNCLSQIKKKVFCIFKSKCLKALMERLLFALFYHFFIIPSIPLKQSVCVLGWGAYICLSLGTNPVSLSKLHETLYSDRPLCVNLNVGRIFRSIELWACTPMSMVQIAIFPKIVYKIRTVHTTIEFKIIFFNKNII